MLRNKFSVVRDNDSYVVKVVGPTGAAAHFDDMREFHLRNDIEEHYLWCRTNDGDVLRWSFPEPAYAEFFIAEFGGELVRLPSGRRERARLSR
jgi:hypothetical protein